MEQRLIVGICDVSGISLFWGCKAGKMACEVLTGGFVVKSPTPPSQHVGVSFGRTQNPKLLIMLKPAHCMRACCHFCANVEWQISSTLIKAPCECSPFSATYLDSCGYTVAKLETIIMILIHQSKPLGKHLMYYWIKLLCLTWLCPVFVNCYHEWVSHAQISIFFSFWNNRRNTLNGQFSCYYQNLTKLFIESQIQTAS